MPPSPVRMRMPVAAGDGERAPRRRSPSSAWPGKETSFLDIVLPRREGSQAGAPSVTDHGVARFMFHLNPQLLDDSVPCMDEGNRLG